MADDPKRPLVGLTNNELQASRRAWLMEGVPLEELGDWIREYRRQRLVERQLELQQRQLEQQQQAPTRGPAYLDVVRRLYPRGVRHDEVKDALSMIAHELPGAAPKYDAFYKALGRHGLFR